MAGVHARSSCRTGCPASQPVACRSAPAYAAPIPTPEDTLARGDPGDETGRRYRYQYAYAAALSCALLADEEEIVELFCEHHEDILLKLRSGRFVGVQVKTRQLGGDPWKTTDVDVVAAIAKFVRNDAAFPDQFERFALVTNHQFFTGKKNGQNLPHVLALAREQPDGTEPTGALKAFVKKVATASGRSVVEVLRTLRKSTCDHDLPKLRDSVASLCDHIRTRYAPCSEASYALLRRAADALADEAERAATLHHEQDLPLYLALRSDAPARDVAERIDGKRLTRERVLRVLSAALQAPPTLLTSADQNPAPAALPALNSKLSKKLNAGGLSATTVHSARDCWASAFKQQLDWNSTLGEERSIERYHHLKALALSEAAAAHEATKSNGAPFGPAMLEDLRCRLRDRRSTRSADVFSTLEEQLLGYVYFLTEECKVWWSEPFDIPEVE